MTRHDAFPGSRSDSAALSKVLALPIATAIALVVAGCSDLPSKGDALETIKQSIKEDATCTLPVTLLSQLKKQHSSKAVCVPREGGPSTDTAAACLDALVTAGITTRMPASYMVQWPDELAGKGFDDVSPYERRSRDLLFKRCVEMTPAMREGMFRCGEAHADKVIRVTKEDDERATVRYARAITFDTHMAAIDAACGAVTRPPPEATVMFERTSDKKWVLSSTPPGSDTNPSESPAR